MLPTLLGGPNAGENQLKYKTGVLEAAA